MNPLRSQRGTFGIEILLLLLVIAAIAFVFFEVDKRAPNGTPEDRQEQCQKQLSGSGLQKGVVCVSPNK